MCIYSLKIVQFRPTVLCTKLTWLRFSLLGFGFHIYDLELGRRIQDRSWIKTLSIFTSQLTEKRMRGLFQGVTERCSLSLLTNCAHVYEPKCKGMGELRGLSQWVQLHIGAQINFGDVTYGLFRPPLSSWTGSTAWPPPHWPTSCLSYRRRSRYHQISVADPGPQL